MDVRLRQDLKITKRTQGLDSVWIIKDPVSLSHFLFSEQEYSLVKLLDGKRQLEEVLSEWSQRFKSSSLSSEQLQQFVRRLIGDNLVIVNRMGYGSSLFHAGQNMVVRNRHGWVANPLAIRIRGVNPTVLLKEIGWIGAWFFHPVVVVSLLLSSFCVLFFLLGNFESVSQRIPAIQHMLSTRGLVGLILTIAIVKLLHELGHALACRRFGAECFEIGVMLLALIPTLYCNVSDAWMIRERWKRMIVSFAGMYVEICLATVAAIAWFMTPPGLLNAMLFNVVMLCSINTILLNGNPLLRYDGYYLLSDWLDQPNLSQAASGELSKVIGGLVRGRDNSTGVNYWLLAYGLLSFLYRWFVIGVIIYGIMALASGWGASEIGLGVCGVLLATMFAGRMRYRMESLKSTTAGPINWLRASIAMFAACVLLLLVLFLPLPRIVYCEFEVNLDKPVTVFAPADGHLVSIVRPYELVATGDLVARLENRQLKQEVEQQQLELERAKNELKQLSSRANEAPAIAARVELAKKNVRAMETKFATIETELKRLGVPAPAFGMIYPAPDRVLTVDGELDVWRGALHDDRNKDCPVRRSEHLLTVGSPDQKQVALFVDEREISFVAKGQQVHLVFDRIPTGRFEGVVAVIFEDEVDSQSSRMNDSSQRANNREDGAVQKTYRVIVDLPEFPEVAVVGSVGRAKIAVANQTLVARLMRVLTRAVNTRL